MRVKSLLLLSFFLLATLAVSLFGLKTVSADSEDYLYFLGTSPAEITPNTSASFFIGSENHTPIECKLDDEDFSICDSNPIELTGLQEGEHTFTAHSIGASNPEATVSHTWNIVKPPELTGGSPINALYGEPIHVTDLQIQDSGNPTLTVQLSVLNGSFELASTSGISFAGPPTGSLILFNGTLSDLNTALASLIYTPTEPGSFTIHGQIMGEDSEDFYTINNHVFKVITPGGSMNWAQAKAAAEASSYNGETGYLASITSAEENNFINKLMSGGAWLGGSDLGTEGDWQWSGGPEANQSFWSGDASGSAVGGAYTSWTGFMPDNFNGNENCLETGRSNTTPTWNDQDCSAQRSSYVVEYGDGVTIPFASSKQITINATYDTDGDSIPNTEEDAGPNSGDANNDSTPDSEQPNVASFLNIVNDHYTVVETDCESLSNVQLGGEASDPADNDYNYPMGLTSFHITCQGNGDTARVRQYYYGVEGSEKYVVRKWLDDGSYTTIPGYSLLGVPIDGQIVFMVQYNLTDGTTLDDDGEANGIIVDPSGAGLPIASDTSAPSTTADSALAGTGQSPLYLFFTSTILILASLMLVHNKRKVIVKN